MKNRLLLYLVTAVAATGGLLFGFDTGIINVALPQLEKQFSFSDFQKGFVTSAVLIGGMMGPFISSKLSDRLGRRKINLYAAVLFAIGSVFTAIAPSINMIIGGRLLLGIAIGIVSSSIPLYLAEIAPAAIRGRLVTFFQLAITIGILVSYFIGFVFVKDAEGWRNMFWAGFIPAIILFLGMLYVPESPRWLLKKGDAMAAEQALLKFNDAETSKAVLSDMQNAIRNEMNQKVNLSDMFSKKLRRPLLIGIGIFFIQQFSGINAIIYYSTNIFEMAGFDAKSTGAMATVGVGVVNVLATFLAMMILDKVGRKTLLYIGLVGTAISLGVVAFAFNQKENLGIETLKVLSISGVYAYIIFFAISLGPLGWLLISEIYPLKVRGLASSMGSFYHWFFDTLVAFSFPILAGTALGQNGGIFLIYMLVCLLGLLFAKFMVFETKGLSLEQIEAKWKST